MKNKKTLHKTKNEHKKAESEKLIQKIRSARFCGKGKFPEYWSKVSLKKIHGSA
jgi:hypothetical protein